MTIVILMFSVQQSHLTLEINVSQCSPTGSDFKCGDLALCKQ